MKLKDLGCKSTVISIILVLIMSTLYINMLYVQPNSDTIRIEHNTVLPEEQVGIDQDFTSTTQKPHDIPVGWTYQQKIMLDPPTTLDNYQIKVNLNPSNFDYSLCNLNGSDIRFTDEFDNYLSYWIETWNVTANSIVWVKVPTAGTDHFYINYGNPSAMSESNGDATFVFFDDFSGTSLNGSKWITDNSGSYSNLTIGGGEIILTTDTPNDAPGGSMGFSDFFVNHGQTYAPNIPNGIAMGDVYVDSRYIVKNHTTGASSNALGPNVPQNEWFVGDIRWLPDQAQLFNESSLYTVTNSSCLPTVPLQVRIIAFSIYVGPGDGYCTSIQSISAVGEPGRALRFHSYHDIAVGTPSIIHVDWLFVRNCAGVEPAATVIDPIIDMNSPQAMNYNQPMKGHYPASYGFENDPSFPYSDTVLFGQPPDGWIPHYSAQLGTIKVLDEYMGHKKVVELVKSYGSYGKARTGVARNFHASTTAGTVEFWLNKETDTGYDASKIILSGSGGSIEFGVENQALYRGAYTSRVNISEYVFPKNTWKHIRVDFDISQGGWQIQLDGMWYGSGYAFPFEGTPTAITGVDIRTHGSEFQEGIKNYRFWFDAVAYSWDPRYKVGDNLKEGLLLDFKQITHQRSDWEAYYPASRGYDEIPAGGQPDNWGYFQGGSQYTDGTRPPPELYVIDSKTDGQGNKHNKVLYCKDNSGGTIFFGTGFFDEPQTSGTIDFWTLNQDGTNYRVAWGLFAADTAYSSSAMVAQEYNEFEVFNKSTFINTGVSFVDNKWYRISMDFSDDGTYAGLGAHQYRARLYDSDGQTLLYTSPELYFGSNGKSLGLRVSTGDSSGANIYLDGVGYSWKDSYDIDDNRFPAVYEGPEWANISWMGYSLDGQPNITITGAVTIPFPTTRGTHTLQVFMNDVYGNRYASKLIQFDIPHIRVYSPQPKTYTSPMAGYYPASYGFENDTTGVAPADWDCYDGSHGFIRTEDSLDGHNKIIQVRKTGDQDIVSAQRNFTAPVSTGKLELWMYKDTDSGTDPSFISLISNLETTAHLQAHFANGDFYYSTGSYSQHTLVASDVFSKNTWHHIVLEFDVSLGWHIKIDDTWYGQPFTFPYRDNNIGSTFTRISVHTLYSGGHTNYGTWIDAVGCSWDPNYNIGDNKKEGLLLSYDSDVTLDWTGYSLDGASNVTISGNTTLNIPSQGNHAIQMFGNDSFGNMYASSLVNFQIDLLPLTITHPADVTINYGDTGYTLTWQAFTGVSPDNYTVYRNGTVYDQGVWMNATNIITSLDGLVVGSYNFTCVVQDFSGKTVHDEVEVIVVKAPPDITHPADITINYGDTGYTLSWEPYTPTSPDTYTIYQNGTTYAQGLWMNATSIVVSLDGLNPIYNNFTCIIQDHVGYIAQDQVWVTVIPPAPDIGHPSDFSVNYGEGSSYSILWSVSSDFPDNYTVYQNGTVYAQGIWVDSVIIWLDGIIEGKHNFTCVVQDQFDNISQDTVWITVLPALPDTTPPLISSPADVTFEEGSIGYSIIWAGSDDRSPWWATITRNTSLVYDQAWIGNNIELSLEGLAIGTYIFNCTLLDEAGNSVSDLVTVTVTEPVPDTVVPTLEHATAITYEEGSVGNVLYWICADAHPYAYQIAINGSIKAYKPWHGENITYNVDGLSIGVYEVNLTLWDLSSNIITDITTITVIPKAPDLTPPVVSSPAALSVTEDMAGIIVWEVNDEEPGWYCIYRNGTLIYENDHWTSGIIQYYFDSLPLGTWDFNLTIWDASGNQASSSAIVQVLEGSKQDTRPPDISHVPDQSFAYGSVNQSVIVYLFDEHPLGYMITIGSDQTPEMNPWSEPNVRVIVSLDGLAIGTYQVNVTAWDMFGNRAEILFDVTVTGDIDPPTISNPDDISVEVGQTITLTWEVDDDHPAQYEIIDIVNDTIIEEGSWTSGTIEYDFTGISPGTYRIRLVVYDSAGNFVFDDVTITITSPMGGGAPGFEFITVLPILVVLVLFKKGVFFKRRSSR